MFQLSFKLLLAVIIAGPIYAHEFWISPVEFQVDAGSPIAAHFRVGQGFKGGSHSYLSRYTARHELSGLGRASKAAAIPILAAIQPAMSCTRQAEL